jgi:Tol biopolymer transport system component
MGFSADRLPPASWVRVAAPIAGVLLLAVVSIFDFAGCAGRSPAGAENREVRLTSDGVVKHSPCFSPDGKWIAYAARVNGSKGGLLTYVMPREGGEARKLSPDTLEIFPLEWSKDGKGIYCSDGEGTRLYFVGLDGSVRKVSDREALTRIVAVSPDGQQEFMLRFNQDNRDLGVRKAGGKFEYLVETPAWEEDVALGPGSGEVTVVATPSYQAPTTTISIWSPTTRSLKPLPLPEGLKYGPTWSADGRYLAYSAIRRGQSDVFVYDATTGIAAPVTDEVADESSPAWSPDGEWLAFSRNRKTSHLYSGTPGSPDRVQLTSGAALDYAPMVSPDGQWIAFFRRTPGGAEGEDEMALCVMPTAGGEVKPFDLHGLTLPSRGGDAIAWSEDSRHIAFTASDGSAKMDIYRIGRDGSGLARVTVASGEEVEPRWSPDGRHISFTQAGGGRLQVGVVPSNGGPSRTVSAEGTKSEGSMWSPDGKQIAHLTIREDGRFEIWAVALADPAQRRRLIESEALVWPLFWSKDGNEVLLVRGKANDWDLLAVSTRTGRAAEAGKGVMAPTGKTMFYELTPMGEKYRKLLYPGGLILNDGEDHGDLYLVPAHSVLGSQALSTHTESLWNGRIVFSGYF